VRKTFVVLAICLVFALSLNSQEEPKRVGIKKLQAPMSELKPTATIELGGKPDWTVITDDAVWVSNSELHAIQRIDPVTNRVVTQVDLPGEPCSGLAYGFGSVWTPICDGQKGLARIDASANRVMAILPVVPADDEGSIATSEDSVWLVTNKEGLLLRIDPKTNSVRQEIQLPPGVFNPIYGDGTIWVTNIEKGTVIAINADTGKVRKEEMVGERPRFLTAGAGSIWVLLQSDGSVTRVDAKNANAWANIPVGIPGQGGEICFGGGFVWATVMDIPLTKIDPQTGQVVKQWVGPGGDSVRYGHGSLWLTDLKHGQMWRIPPQ
jgi:streptogramin lyase